jgi:hypothetical protein
MRHRWKLSNRVQDELCVMSTESTTVKRYLRLAVYCEGKSKGGGDDGTVRDESDPDSEPARDEERSSLPESAFDEMDNDGRSSSRLSEDD